MEAYLKKKKNKLKITPSPTQIWNTYKYDMLMKVRHRGDAPMDILIGHGYLGGLV